MTVPYHVRGKPVSIKEGMEHQCRKCGADVGVMCVYLAGLWESSPNRYRVGQPCSQIHNERRQDARHARVKKWKRDNTTRDHAHIKSLAASPDSRAAWRSMLEWERQEHETLSLWLRTWGHILTTKDA